MLTELGPCRGNIPVKNPWENTDWEFLYGAKSIHDLGGYQRELIAITTHRLVDSLDLGCMEMILEMRDESTNPENLIRNIMLLKGSQLCWIETVTSNYLF